MGAGFIAGPALGTVAEVGSIGLVAGAEGIINNQLNNAVKGAENDVKREKG